MRWFPPLVALLLFAVAAHGQDGSDAERMKRWESLVDRHGATQDDAERLAIEKEALAEPPLPAAAVGPLAKRLFALAADNGPRLKKSGKSYFYDAKDKRGLYLVSGGRKGGGLLLALHGGGEGAGSASNAHGIWAGATSQEFTVVSPEAMKKVSSAWNEEQEERFVLDLIEAAKRTFDVDTDRICVAGHSMGGDGSWMIGGRNADLFAAAAPLAGSVMPYMRPGMNNKLETPISDYLGLQEGVIPNLMWLPYHIHHSDDDRNEAIHPDDIATGYLTRLQRRFPGRYGFTYDRVSGNGHALPQSGVKPIQRWLGDQVRVTYPREVVWETWWPWKRQMYWLHHPAPDDAWRFHARIEGEGLSNRVEVTGTTKRVAGRTEPKELELTLLLSPRLFDFDRPLVVTCDGATIHEGPIHRTLWSLLVSIGRRNDAKQWFEGHVTVTIPRRSWKDFWEEE